MTHVISVSPQAFRFSICHSNIGFPAMGIIGLGTSLFTEAMRVPLPPAIITTFIGKTLRVNTSDVHLGIISNTMIISDYPNMACAT